MRLVIHFVILLIFIEISDEIHQKHRKRRKRQQIEEEDPLDSDEIIDYSDDNDDDPPEKIELLNDFDHSNPTSWQNPDHPERRQGRYMNPDNPDDQTEFVRTEFSDQVYKKIRTFGTAGMPRQIECFSCMSMSYQMSWKYLQSTYIWPKVFTDRCRDPYNEPGIPVISCSSVCISMMEPDIEAGVLIGYKHIRGCMDKVLRHGFNQTALGTHRFQQNSHYKNHCRTLNRASLFNPARSTDPPAIGEVHLCSCYGNKCNTYHTSSSFRISPISPLLVFLLYFIFL